MTNAFYQFLEARGDLLIKMQWMPRFVWVLQSYSNLCAEKVTVMSSLRLCNIHRVWSLSRSAAVCARFCRIYLRLLQHQCLMTEASAPQHCSSCAQTIIRQRVDICRSALAEPPSAKSWVLSDLAWSRGEFLAVFDSWGGTHIPKALVNSLTP